jgi:hypothetical protein
MPEFYDTKAPKGLSSAQEAMDQGKRDSKPSVLLFLDSGLKSDIFLRMLGDPALPKDLFDKVAFARVEFKKDTDEAKKWKVLSAPTLVIIDNTKDAPKVLKTLTGGSGATVKKELEEAAKLLQKK